METAVPSLSAYLDEPLEAGEPDVAGPLAVFPLFGPATRFEYQSFAQGRAHGVTIKELDGGASVRDLVVVNPTSVPVLLFEGEEVLGAQQNRTFDVSVLVGARSTMTVPVSCVEAQRWDSSRRGESFEPAPQTAYPTLRRMKNEAALAQLVEGAAARADQGAVWQEVDRRLDALAATAPTRALHDGYEQRRHDLRELASTCSFKPGQTGMLVAIAGRFSVLDRISQAQVFSSLYDPLVQGYALDSIDADVVDAPSLEEARTFVDRVAAQPISERDAIGLGRDVRISGDEVTGAGLVCAGELVQISIFVRGHDRLGTRLRSGRIRRPSRRCL